MPRTPSEEDSRPSHGCAALAAFVPLAYFVAGASGHGYWLDAGEMVAAGRELGISHPPGHPLTGLWGGIVALLPVGPLSFRIAVGSALCAAGALFFFYRAVFRTLGAVGLTRPVLSVPLSLAACWMCASAGGYVLQAVRPEVYALQAFMTCVVLDAVLAYEIGYPDADPRLLYAAAFVHGLALANHHFIALLLLPAVAPSVARLFVGRGPRALGFVALAGATGLSTYLYLPLRASAGPPLNLGQPDSFGRLLWVVSAQAFQKNTGDGVPLPFTDRLFDVIAASFEALTPAIALGALGGLYFLFRLRSGRRLALVWGLTALASLLARAWLGFVRSNPDALGYLLPAFFALTALAAGLVGLFLSLMVQRRGPALALSRSVVVTFAVLSFVRLHTTVGAQGLQRFAATDALDEVRLRSLPPRAVVLAHAPGTIFRYFGTRAEERIRPDVTLVPLPLLTYPEMVATLVEREPELTQLLRGYLLHGQLRQPDLQTLASRRPLLLEMDVRVSPELYDTLAPQGMFYRVLPGGTTEGDERAGAREQFAMYEDLYGRLGDEARQEETRKVLLWQHYNDALYYAGYGDRKSAQGAVAYGLALQPESQELRAMREALARHKGKLDVRRFLPSD